MARGSSSSAITTTTTQYSTHAALSLLLLRSLLFLLISSTSAVAHDDHQPNIGDITTLPSTVLKVIKTSPSDFMAHLSRPAEQQYRHGHQQPPQDEQAETPPHVAQAGVIRVGPWGGEGGSLADVGSASRLTTIHIRYEDVIIGLRIFYIARGTLLDFVIGATTGGGWRETKISLAPGEHFTSLSGYITNYEGVTCVGQLSFATNRGLTYGPYGRGGGTPFSLPIANGRIVNFFGRGGIYVDAIGVYVAPS